LILKSRVIVVIPRLRKGFSFRIPQDFKSFQPLMVDLVIPVIQRLKKVLASGLPQDFSGLKPKP